MKHPLWLAVPCTLALLTACSPGMSSGSSDPVSADEMQSEVSGSVLQDVQSALAVFGSDSVQAQSSCRSLDSSSVLGPDGKPLDTDNDGVPDKAVWDLTGCMRDGLTVNGQRETSDPDPTSASPVTYVDSPINLSEAFTRLDGSVRTTVRNGESDGTISGSSLTIARNVSETVTDSLHTDRSASWHNGVTVNYATADGSTITFRAPLPAGTVSVNGPREWDITNAQGTFNRYLQITTTTPLTYDPTCDGTGNRIFGSSHARTGAFTVQVYADSAHSQLLKTVLVSFENCVASTTMQ